MFWAAINAGDRVDSALKDMAVVMKQLNRSDEAIEAIKSFRHLCPYDSQESLDNILIELYKVKYHSLPLISLHFTSTFLSFSDSSGCCWKYKTVSGGWVDLIAFEAYVCHV